MGAIHMGPPHELVLGLQREFGLQTFVETGTYEGRTAAWAARHFSRVITVERAASLWDAARRRFAGVRNIEFVRGDSREALRRMGGELREPALLWLDGHWSGGETFGQEDECPLLGELAALRSAAARHFLLIDDARLFAAPPPPPHRAEQWPTLPEVFDALREIDPTYYIVVVDDAIIAAPTGARAWLVDHLRHGAAAPVAAPA